MDMEEGEYDPSAPEMNGGVLLACASPGSMTFGYGDTAGFRRQAPANRIRSRRVRNGVTEELYISEYGVLTWIVGGAVPLTGTRDEDEDEDEDDDVEQDDDDPYGDGRFGAVPASEAEIVRLQMATPGEVREEDCAVCLDSFEEGEVLVKMTCPSSHGFHEGCIVKWLRVSRLCPLCRFALPAELDLEEKEEEEMDTERDETPLVVMVHATTGNRAEQGAARANAPSS